MDSPPRKSKAKKSASDAEQRSSEGEKTIEAIWRGSVNLPTDIRNKSLYKLSFKKLGELCKKYDVAFCNDLNFWKGKMIYDGYIIPDRFDEWVDMISDSHKGESNLPDSDNKTLADIFGSLEDYNGSLTWLDVDSMDEYVREHKSMLEVFNKLKFPKGFPKEEFRNKLEEMSSLLKKPWENWENLDYVQRYLRLQKSIVEERRKNKLVIINLPLHYTPNKAYDYDKYIKEIKDNEDTIDLSRIPSNIYGEFIIITSEDGDITNSEAERNKVIKILLFQFSKLKDLLQTGDILDIGIEKYSKPYFIVREDNKVTMIPFDYENKNYSRGERINYYFPREALDTIVIKRIKNNENFDKVYAQLSEYRTAPDIKGFSSGDKDRGYKLPKDKKEKQKEIQVRTDITIPYVDKPVKVIRSKEDELEDELEEDEEIIPIKKKEIDEWIIKPKKDPKIKIKISRNISNDEESENDSDSSAAHSGHLSPPDSPLPHDLSENEDD